MFENGLASVNKIYQNRSSRAKELRAAGKNIFGYFCCQTPVEILTAADIIPFRIMGNVKQKSSEVDAHLEPIACPFTRSCLNMAVKGEYDFFDGFVVPHACDNIVKIYDIWRHNTKPAFSHFINVPHTTSQPAHKFLEAEIGTFKKHIEKFTGEAISPDRLQESIDLHNHNRALVREMYDLRKGDPPKISGSEIIKILVAVMSLPVIESIELLKSVIKEINHRKNGPQKKPVRLLIYGSEIDATNLIDIIEESGANVVMDDLSIGSRPFWHDVEKHGASLKDISDHYLDKITCPRVFREVEGTHRDDLENRFGYLYDFAKDFNVNGIIVHVMRYCDTFAFDLPDVKEFFKIKGFPVYDIEDEYEIRAKDRIKNRIEAFVEIIS